MKGSDESSISYNGESDPLNSWNTRNMQPFSTEMWNHYKELIRRLYLDENNKLKDVMTIMRERYGFKAS